ncbi:hypothetical protein T210_0124765 [Burkholderia pseudomallei MSHR6137]|nr:hypothetical protein T210_0124765 [Burkholderia pseudomallei MSHR6137]
MDCIVYVRMLAQATLKYTSNGFPSQLYAHPTPRLVVGDVGFSTRCGIRAHFADDAVKVLIPLRDTHEAANLADAVCVPSDYRETGV